MFERCLILTTSISKRILPGHVPGSLEVSKGLFDRLIRMAVVYYGFSGKHSPSS